MNLVFYRVNLAAFRCHVIWKIWDIIGLVKGFLFADARAFLEPMFTLCSQFIKCARGHVIFVNEILLLLVISISFHLFIFLVAITNALPYVNRCFVSAFLCLSFYALPAFFMMTSSNGNIFRVTGPLCGEFTDHRWIPLTKASDAEFGVFFVDLRRHRAHYDAILM